MKKQRGSERRHWDSFWKRDRDLDEIYDNDGRITEETLLRMDVRGLLVMEVGAATARDSVELSGLGAVCVALDYSMEALRLAREAASRAGAALFTVCGDALALPFRDGSLDLVFHQGVLEHFRDPAPLLLENARVLKTGGILLADVPQTFHPYTLVKKSLMALDAWFAGWETQYTRRGLERRLLVTGLRPCGAYARYFSPSLAYRMLRELLMKTGLRLPLRPVLCRSVHRLRTRLRRSIERSAVGPLTGCVIGVFARKED
jgi:SAM-dependent methyltransferase